MLRRGGNLGAKLADKICNHKLAAEAHTISVIIVGLARRPEGSKCSCRTHRPGCLLTAQVLPHRLKAVFRVDAALSMGPCGNRKPCHRHAGEGLLQSQQDRTKRRNGCKVVAGTNH
jgi:hypothetical protein